MDDERRAPRADRPLVVVGDQRRHRGEDLVDVDALDCDELGADEVAPAPHRRRRRRRRTRRAGAGTRGAGSGARRMGGSRCGRSAPRARRLFASAPRPRHFGTSESSASTRAASRSSVWRSTARNGSGCRDSIADTRTDASPSGFGRPCSWSFAPSHNQRAYSVMLHGAVLKCESELDRARSPHDRYIYRATLKEAAASAPSTAVTCYSSEPGPASERLWLVASPREGTG